MNTRKIVLAFFLAFFVIIHSLFSTCETSSSDLTNYPNSVEATQIMDDSVQLHMSLGSEWESVEDMNKAEIDIDLSESLDGNAIVTLDLSGGWLSTFNVTYSIDVEDQGARIHIELELGECTFESGHGALLVVNIGNAGNPIDATALEPVAGGLIILDNINGKVGPTQDETPQPADLLGSIVNPVTDHIVVNNPPRHSQWELRTLTGKLLRAELANSDVVRMSTEALPPGVYSIQVFYSDENGQLRQRQRKLLIR